jgi:hypothetical protein
MVSYFKVRLILLPTNVRQGCKYLEGANITNYFAEASVLIKVSYNVFSMNALAKNLI